MSVQILIDNTADLSREEAKQLGIRIVPLTVHFDDHQYINKFMITDEKFYGMLNTEAEIPTTTQVSLQSFPDVYAEYPNDEIMGIYISQRLGSTYQSVVITKKGCGRSDVYPIDSTTVSAGMTLLVHEAIRLRDEGENGKETAEYITRLTKHVGMLAVLNTMKYLVKDGRLSSTEGTIGNLLGIRPIIWVKDSILEVIGKERGTKKARDFVIHYLREFPDFDSSMSIACLHGFNQQDLNALKQGLGEEQALLMDDVVGTCAGPGAILVGCFHKWNTKRYCLTMAAERRIVRIEKAPAWQPMSFS